MPAYTEATKLELKIGNRLRKAIMQYGLIENEDKILVGLSGGKDSLCLLEMLAKQVRIRKPEFKIEAVHVRMENIRYETDTAYLQRFAESNEVPLHVITTRFDVDEKCKKPACFLCSWHRRKQIFNLAQELGCSKIALGHHMDDIIHTAMLNQFFQGHFSTMPVKLRMTKMPLTIIRPLCLNSEADIMQHALNKKYEKQIKQCPYETDSHRNDMKRLFGEIERMNPEARFSLWNALEAEGKLTE